ncbi:hypothetical protein [Thermotoga sp. SG1]|uniref:hypothetical protein n=1 Tax=Thermotoga sp. SG1 TaxID=126739 RepID=UPI000C77A786|nr:hypothetical protein [Thermotoga sp. SG1]PLV57002.1 hypothetical protein AS006_05265 [Thermotoga sp. SG1]
MTTAYLDSKKLGGKFVGGLLVVDERGIPQEFKYTEPVVPSELQRILYGGSLEVYLKTELIARTLLKKMEKNPDFIFVRDPELLEADERLVLLVERNERVEEPVRISEEEAILPFKGTALKVIGKLSDDRLEKLLNLLETFDVLEPFQRLDRALEYVCSGE